MLFFMLLPLVLMMMMAMFPDVWITLKVRCFCLGIENLNLKRGGKFIYEIMFLFTFGILNCWLSFVRVFSVVFTNKIWLYTRKYLKKLFSGISINFQKFLFFQKFYLSKNILVITSVNLPIQTDKKNYFLAKIQLRENMTKRIIKKFSFLLKIIISLKFACSRYEVLFMKRILSNYRLMSWMPSSRVYKIWPTDSNN